MFVATNIGNSVGSAVVFAYEPWRSLTVYAFTACLSFLKSRDREGAPTGAECLTYNFLDNQILV